MQIKWQRGKYLTFYAQMKIRIGGKDTYDIQKGDCFEYDGSIVKYAGADFAQPGLRGAISEGWATLDESEARIAPVRPERKVAKARSVNTDLQNIQRDTARVLTSNDLDEETIIEVGARAEARAAGENDGGHLSQSNTMRIASSLQDQDGVTVSRVLSPASIKVDVTEQPGMVAQIQGRSFESGYGRADGASGKRKVVRQEGIEVSVTGDMTSDVISYDSDGGNVIGSVRDSAKLSSEEVRAHAIGGAKEPKMAKEKKISKAKSKSSGNGSSGNGKVSPKLQVAREVDPSFPDDWNFFAKAEDKLSRIKDMDASPEFWQALLKAEGKKFLKLLKQEYPNQFK